MARIIILCLLCYLCTAPTRAAAEGVIIFTEENPPFNFRNEEGEIDGISTRLVRKLMDKTGLDYEIRLVSWVRAMRNAQLLDNALIYSLVRTEERSEQFDWLVPLTVTQFFLYSRRDFPQPILQEDIMLGKYKAVCPLKSYPCVLLEALGFPEKNIYSISFLDIVEQYRMVVSGRVDFFVNEPLTHTYSFELGNSPYSRNTFVRALSVGAKSEAFLATGKHVKPELMQRIGETYERMLRRGTYVPITLETAEQALREVMK